MKAKLSTKMLDENIEHNCETKFNRIRSTAFSLACFEKDNDAGSGSKGDYEIIQKIVSYILHIPGKILYNYRSISFVVSNLNRGKVEYFRNPKNQIYADIAFRLGLIIIQYEEMVIDGEKFEATLYLTVLQNLMTNSNEYIRNMAKSERRNSIFNKEIFESIWGVNNSCWVKNTFNEKPTLQNFITRIRNSVSHPTNIDIQSDFPSTGFTTIKNEFGIIDKFRFVNSPDSRKNRIKELTEEEVFSTIYQRNSNNQRIHAEFPDSITYREIPNIPGKYQLMSNGELFVRVSIIDLSVKQLGEFVKNLANYLAQPIQKNWDGVTIKNLIAA